MATIGKMMMVMNKHELNLFGVSRMASNNQKRCQMIFRQSNVSYSKYLCLHLSGMTIIWHQPPNNLGPDHLLTPSLRHAGLIFFYFGNSGIISKWGLISETMIRVGLNFFFFVIPGIITVKFLL